MTVFFLPLYASRLPRRGDEMKVVGIKRRFHFIAKINCTNLLDLCTRFSPETPQMRVRWEKCPKLWFLPAENEAESRQQNSSSSSGGIFLPDCRSSGFSLHPITELSHPAHLPLLCQCLKALITYNNVTMNNFNNYSFPPGVSLKLSQWFWTRIMIYLHSLFCSTMYVVGNLCFHVISHK